MHSVIKYTTGVVSLLTSITLITAIVLEQMGYLVLTIAFVGPMWFTSTVAFLVFLALVVHNPVRNNNG